MRATAKSVGVDELWLIQVKKTTVGNPSGKTMLRPAQATARVARGRSVYHNAVRSLGQPRLQQQQQHRGPTPQRVRWTVTGPSLAGRLHSLGFRFWVSSRKSHTTRDEGISRWLSPPRLILRDQVGSTCSRCLLYTSPSPRDGLLSRMPSSA